jgi:hypothetical protein
VAGIQRQTSGNQRQTAFVAISLRELYFAMRETGEFSAADTLTRAAAAPVSAKTLPYDHGGGTVSVRGFRLLVVLTLVNTALLASMVLGPQLFPFARQQFQSWKNARAEKQRIAARLAAEKLCRNHSVPADRVVYEEDPVEAAKLLKLTSPVYERTPADGNGVVPGWVAPAHAAFPACYSQYLGGTSSSYGNYPLLFLHERTTAAGETFLVTVHLHSRSTFTRSAQRDRGPGEVFRFYQLKQRTIIASYSPVGGGSSQYPPLELNFSLPDQPNRVVATLEEGQRLDASPAIDYGNVLRIYAGQPDPEDASHFTIAYALDGHPGTIDGWVRNNGMELRPREGTRTYEAKGGEAWKLPTTRPVGTE